MMALATLPDLVARIGRDLTCEEEARVQALLDDASALVAAFTGQTFDLVEDDEITVRAQGAVIRLPQRPVTAVSSVVAVGGAGLPDIPLADWRWDGLDMIRLGDGYSVINLPERWWDDQDGYPGTFRVTYSHGYAKPPPEVVSVVCGMVLRTLTAPTTAGGIVSETIGPYSYRLDSAGAGTAVSLGDADRRMLARFRRTTTTTSTRMI